MIAASLDWAAMTNAAALNSSTEGPNRLAISAPHLQSYLQRSTRFKNPDASAVKREAEEDSVAVIACLRASLHCPGLAGQRFAELSSTSSVKNLVAGKPTLSAVECPALNSAEPAGAISSDSAWPSANGRHVT